MSKYNHSEDEFSETELIVQESLGRYLQAGREPVVLGDAPMPTCDSVGSAQYYQRETQRLRLETEIQRREIGELRRDLASALTQHVRASIIVNHIEFGDESGPGRHDLKLAIGNWKETSFGEPADVLARIDTLSKALP